MQNEMRFAVTIGVLTALAGAAAVACAGPAGAWGLLLEAVGLTVASIAVLRRPGTPAIESPPRGTGLFWGAALVGLSLAAHWRTLGAGFPDADDWAALFLARVPADPGAFFPQFMEWSLDRAIHLSHAGLFALFAAERAVFGVWAPGYHAVNLVLVGLAGWCVFDLARRFVRDDAAAFFGAALFVLHPRLWELATVTSRAEWTMLIICCLGATSAYLRHLDSGRRRDLALSIAGVFAAAFMREAAVLAPLLIVGAVIATGRRRVDFVPLVPHALVAAILAIHLFGPHLAGRPGGGYSQDACLFGPGAGNWGELARTVFAKIPLSLFAPAPPAAAAAHDWLNPFLAAANLFGVALLAREVVRGGRTPFLGLFVLTLGALPLAAHGPGAGFEDRHLVWTAAGWAMLAAAAFAAVPGRKLLRAGVAAALAVAFFVGTSAASRASIERERMNMRALDSVAKLAKKVDPSMPVVIALDCNSGPGSASAFALAAFTGRPAGEVIVARDAVFSQPAAGDYGRPRGAAAAALVHERACECRMLRPGRIDTRAPAGSLDIVLDLPDGPSLVTSGHVRTYRSAFDVLRGM